MAEYSSTFTATYCANYAAGNMFNTRWRTGLMENAGAVGYVNDTYRTYFGFNAASISSALSGKVVTSMDIKLTHITWSSGFYVSGTVYVWRTSLTALPTAAEATTHMTGLTTPTTTNSYWVERTGSFYCSAVSGSVTEATFVTGTDAQNIANDLIAGKYLGFFNPGVNAGVTQNTALNYVSGATTTNQYPIITIYYRDPYSIYTNVAGVWKGGRPWVNVAGTWREGDAWVNVGGVWKLGQ